MDELEEYEVKDYPGPPDIQPSSDEDFEEEFDEDEPSDSETITLILNRVNNLEALYANISDDIAALKVGINTIGEMMNGVAGAFDQIMAEVQKGGVAGLLGTLMGGKKNG